MPPSQQTMLTIIFLAFIAGFLLYHGIITSAKVSRYIESATLPDHASRNKIIVYRLTGFFSFFVIPAAVVFLLPQAAFGRLGLMPVVSAQTLIFSLVIAVPLVLLSVLTSKSETNLREYPQIRQQQWGGGLLVVSAFTWMMYLFAYEFTFRGILFFSLIEPLGVMPAIAINVVIYSLVHVPKSFREAVGSVPLGVVLCLATLETGNFMVAFIAHCFLALSNEWLSIYHHPEMNYKRSKA